MRWDDSQKGALREVDHWFKNGGRRFYLGGLAGSGKTTLARHFAEGVGEGVYFGAFTGKAASVLRKKGCPGATTIHSLIYRPTGDTKAADMDLLTSLMREEEAAESPDQGKLATWRREYQQLEAEGGTGFSKKDASVLSNAKLVIIDESSMVDSKMGQDLESWGVPVLYLGDPGQLPPVFGKPHMEQSSPDYMLDTIHRQGADSPILDLAYKVREGIPAAYGSFGDGQVEILRRAEFDIQRVVEADQVITGMNNTRFKLTRAMRAKLGHTKLYPLAGEKLICRNNNHEEMILNGVHCAARLDSVKKKSVLDLSLDYEGRNVDFLVDPGHFEMNYGQRLSHPRMGFVEHFDYGYVITGHKSQGSQYRNVVICDDKMRLHDRDMRAKWLYTTITRAEERLTIYV